MSTPAAVLAALARVPATWSMHVADADSGEVLIELAPDTVLRTASMAKVLLLAETARRIEAGTLDATEPLRRDPALAVADSGIWRHLSVDTLPLTDVARLVGLSSDNWATNVLLARVGGPDAVATCAGALGVRDATLHDRVRDERTDAHPPTLSTGSAAAYADVFGRLHRGTFGGAAVSDRVRGWLRSGLDCSMVAAAFGLDPLSHGDGPDRGLSLVSKTGTDDGVRADAGIVAGPARTVAYACLANWVPEGDADPVRDDVLDAMRRVGAWVRAVVTAP